MTTSNLIAQSQKAEPEHIRTARVLREAAVAVADSNPMLAQRLHQESGAIFAAGEASNLRSLEDQSANTIFQDLRDDLTSGGGLARPTSGSVKFGFTELQLVNWYDYKGWEVRVRANQSTEDMPHFLGHIRVREEDGVPAYQATSGTWSHEFGTPAQALRALLALSQESN